MLGHTRLPFTWQIAWDILGTREALPGSKYSNRLLSASKHLHDLEERGRSSAQPARHTGRGCGRRHTQETAVILNLPALSPNGSFFPTQFMLDIVAKSISLKLHSDGVGGSL